MQLLKKTAATFAIAALTTVGLGTTSASAAEPEFYATADATTAVEPTVDPCPTGYAGIIVGFDDSNGSGKRVYACYKLFP